MSGIWGGWIRRSLNAARSHTEESPMHESLLQVPGIGPVTAKLLAEAGYEVAATVRPTSPLEALADLEVERCPADLQDVEDDGFPVDACRADLHSVTDQADRLLHGVTDDARIRLPGPQAQCGHAAAAIQLTFQGKNIRLKAAIISSVPKTNPNRIPQNPYALEKVTERNTWGYFSIRDAFEGLSGL